MTTIDMGPTGSWQSCHKGSCHRHQECMYRPCCQLAKVARQPKTADDFLALRVALDRDERIALRDHAERWQSRRHDLQSACGAAGLHEYQAKLSTISSTRSCRICGHMEPRT